MSDPITEVVGDDAGQCAPDVYRNGTVVFLTHTIDGDDIEIWVKSVAKASGQLVDWSFTAGRAVIKALGDLHAVRVAILMLRPMHDEMMLRALNKCLPRSDEINTRYMQGIWDYNSFHLMGADEEYGSEGMRMWKTAMQERNEARDIVASFILHADCTAVGVQKALNITDEAWAMYTHWGDSMNREAYDKMRAAELEYLLANGWFQEGPGDDSWTHPEDPRHVTQGHAVNIQKQSDRGELRYGRPLA